MGATVRKLWRWSCVVICISLMTACSFPTGEWQAWVVSMRPTPTLTPTLNPTQMAYTPTPMVLHMPSLYTLQGTVRVQTFDGEVLYLRSAPTRDSEILMHLEDDMLLTVIAGPILAEGFTWWQVRTEEGLEGWAVEHNHDLWTLIPI
jgi:hypothetical protein